MSLLRSGYYGLSWLGAPLVLGYLKWRASQGYEDKERLKERIGITTLPRPDKPILWIHAVSVGEAVAALTIVQAILKTHPEIYVVLTTTTVSSARVIGKRLPKNTIHQYGPVDTPQAVNRFLDYWQPDLAIWIESELWPNLLYQTQEKGIPTILLNGRISSKSFSNWRKLRGMISPLLGGLSLCAVQSEEQASFFQALGAKTVSVMGNAKLMMTPLEVDLKKYSSLKEKIGKRPVWLAASTHPGEEVVVFKAHKALRKNYPNLLTILVPRHIKRATHIQDLAKNEGIQAGLRTQDPSLDTIELYIGDTLGEMGVFYALSSVVFMGATFVPKGGHNPIEAVQLGAFVLHGPHIFNNFQLYDVLGSLDLSQKVQESSQLASLVSPWLKIKKEEYNEPEKLQIYREKGLQNLMKLLTPHLATLRRERG
jgi:3-deoxy-D-manno-octulosonic-acid transferase